jgi:hypothetical protein
MPGCRTLPTVLPYLAGSLAAGKAAYAAPGRCYVGLTVEARF